MVTISATKAREEFYHLINNTDEPVVITGKHGNKVMISEEDWRAIEETMYLNSVPGMVESIQAAHSGDFVPESELEW